MKLTFIAAALFAGSLLSLNNSHAAEVLRISPQLEQQVISWRRDLHQHPELSNREFRTAKVVEDHLRKLGLEVQTGSAAGTTRRYGCAASHGTN